jgi:hypothetical protein
MIIAPSAVAECASSVVLATRSTAIVETSAISSAAATNESMPERSARTAMYAGSSPSCVAPDLRGSQPRLGAARREGER